MYNDKVYIIAEAGVNHNGSIDIAEKMVIMAAEAGADAIKFQTFKAENLVSRNAPKAEYQLNATRKEESQYDMLKNLEIGIEEHHRLIKCCKDNHIDFLSTPFDEQSLRLLNDICQIPIIKIASGEITNAPFILQIARTLKPVILSTGMCTLADIENALSVLAFGYLDNKEKPSEQAFLDAYMSNKGQLALRKNVTLLHCTTEYPTPFSDVNLRCMDTLRHSFNLKVGYSDHTKGGAIPLAAVARGASVIEKHFTLDKNFSGPDHQASMDVIELKNMVRNIRIVEESFGSSVKKPTLQESKNRIIARKSLVADTFIRKGEYFTAENISIKRPGDGRHPIYYWDILGKKAQKNYKPDEKV
ncbi:MAG: N-acetylneuraminate synthase [Proteocatella sp.]